VTCQELVEFLLSYLDGELSAGERNRFERHLEECPDCVAYLATYQEAVRLGKAVCTCGETIPRDVPYQLVQAVMAARARAWA
jgi:anti-sigma factor RsiW